jgi:cytochrome c oxidase accessory protein FixG
LATLVTPNETPPPAVAPPSRTSAFEAAPEEELLYSMSADGRRKYIHPTVRRGRYWKIRRAMAYGLFALFFALPVIPVGGYPAVFFNLVDGQSHVFGLTFHPTDNLILAAFGLGIIVTVFFVGSTFGRMWCGYACPQTVYLEFLFRPIEAFLEGGPVNQIKLNAAPWSARKLRIKATKWAIWTVVALAMAMTFVAYFVGWGPLLRGLAAGPLAMKGAIFAIAAVTVLILFDFGWFRDQMCTVACPYGRLQNVMADADTILVAYDEKRGEPKARERDRVAGILWGDCIDCKSCVASCPTGTDIRRGLQPECIGSAQCIDACDVVMLRVGKPIGLIKYTSAREQQGGVHRILRPRTIAYLALLLVTWGAFAALVATRGDAWIEILRTGREAYRLLPTGEVANQMRLRIKNRREDLQAFTVEILSPKGAQLVVSQSPVVVKPQELVTVDVVTSVSPGVFQEGQIPARYRIRSDRGFLKEIDFLLLGPYGTGGATP